MNLESVSFWKNGDAFDVEIAGRRAITADTALRLARYFGTSPQFWTNLQANYDIEVAQDAVGKQIDGEIQPHRAA
jgi:plasmid maintenance system antidote protein VapI